MADPFIGQIVMFGGNFAPVGWALCNGDLLLIAQNTALFSILGTTYGGDGNVTFAIPDLRARVPMGVGNGPGLANRSLGEKGGGTAQLSVANLPAHGHTINVFNQAGSTTEAQGAYLAATSEDTYHSASNDTMHAAAVGQTGSGTRFNVVPPFTAVNFIIAVVGIFPSQN